MSAFIIPILLTLVGIAAVFYTYGSIKRGGARAYTLEREAILRRATTALTGSTLLFVGAVGLLIYQGLPSDAVLDPATTAPVVQATLAEGVPGQQAATPIPNNNIPALLTVTPEPTIDPNLPTATPTITIVRAFITGTSGNGLNLRQTPGGELIEILPEDTFVTVIDEPSVEQGGFAWLKVRTFTGEEGWVVTDFLSIEGNLTNIP